MIDASIAAHELLHRRSARRNLVDFITYTLPRYIVEPFHLDLGAHLDRVSTGELKNVMVFAPPQHGKSQQVSRHFPAFCLGKYPEEPIIMTSYASSLAHSMSRDARNVVESNSYRAIFDIKTDESSRAVDHWRIGGHRGSLIAAGVGGPITGHGAMLGIIDDPIENYEQAQSDVYREKLWNWYQSTFYSRIWEGGRIVIVNTRWHEDDLCGRLLQDQPDRWLVLRYPALAETQDERDEANALLGLEEGLPDALGREEGEPLCPKRFSKEKLEEVKATVVPGVWYALYQGSPRARSGNRFQREWFQNNIVSDLPIKFDVLVRYWDKASSVGKRASYTCGVLMGRSHGVYYVIDVKRGKWTPSQRELIIRNTAITDKERFGYTKIFIEQEPGSGGKDSVISTVKNLAGFTAQADKVTGSKETRSEPYEAQCRAMNVKIYRAHWNWEYLEELAAYPTGRNMDQVDASSGAFNKLASAGIFFA